MGADLVQDEIFVTFPIKLLIGWVYLRPVAPVIDEYCDCRLVLAERLKEVSLQIADLTRGGTSALDWAWTGAW